MRTIILALCFFTYGISSNINVKIEGIKDFSGVLYIGLYNKKEGFKDYFKDYEGKALIVKSDTIKSTFENIPNGTYAIAVFNDLNQNLKVDRNFFGIPKEQYGFSNNPNVFGEADFEDAMFDLVSDKDITIKMN